MQVQIFTKTDATFECEGLDRTVEQQSNLFIMPESWYKLKVSLPRTQINDILIGGESIKHCINTGVTTKNSFEIWLHGNPATYLSRIAKCIALDDLLRYKDLSKKYLVTESWNEEVEGDFIPTSVKQFFANGDGPHWYHKEDFYNLPYVNFDHQIDTDVTLEEDLTFKDTKFYGAGNCRSLQPHPVLPTIKTEQIKNSKLRLMMQQFGFTDILQMQYVELQPNSALPVHRDDFTYQDGKDIIDGPTQLYCVLSGDVKNIKFKFKNVGLIDVDKPIFINNHRFVHSLVYTGNQPRGVFLAYGIRKPK